MLEPTTTPSVKSLIFSTSVLSFIPNPATIGNLDKDLTNFIALLKFSTFAEFWPVIPVIVT